MTHLMRVVFMVLMIAGYLLPDSAFCKATVAPQKIFATAKDAAKALCTAFKSVDKKAVAEILGDSALRLFSSGDPVIDRLKREWFLSLYN